MTQSAESFALQLRIHTKGFAPIQYDNIWRTVTEGYASDASQAVHLKNSQRANVLFYNSSCFIRAQQS
jgi:hypothetical protein